MIARWAVLLVTLATTLAACGRVGPPGAGAGDWPAGRSFLSTSVTENGVPKVLVAGTRIELRFGERGQFSANAGCNGMAGTGRIRDGVLAIADLSVTDMACPDGRMAQDAWVADFLTAGPRLRLEADELTLTGETLTMTLTDRRVVDPDRPLAGTRWVVDTLLQGESASSVHSDLAADLVIDASGAFRASTGCAGAVLTGRAEISVGRVAFTVTEQTPCAGGTDALDTAVRDVLTGERAYDIVAARLWLRAPDGTGLGLLAET